MSTTNKPSHLLMVTGSRSWTNTFTLTKAIRDLYLKWAADASPITAPLLLSGACPRGADAIAEQFWSEANLPIRRMPADWNSNGRAAGFIRNQQMVDTARAAADAGAVVTVLAFPNICTIPGCPYDITQNMLASTGLSGHYSHGTAHAAHAAHRADLEVHVIPHP